MIFTSTKQFVGKQLKIYLKHPQFTIAGVALIGQCDFASIMDPPEVSLKGKSSQRKIKKAFFVSIFERNAAFSRLLMDRSVTALRILIKYVRSIFLSSEVFEGFVLDDMLEAVDILSRF